MWDFDKNINLNPNNIQSSDTKTNIWLKCPVDGFSWEKLPCAIAVSWKKGSDGCPACAGRTKKLVKQVSLFEAYPELVKQYWDYEKNAELDPKIITLGSNKKVWFKCIHGTREAVVVTTITQQWSKGNTGCKSCDTRQKLRDKIAVIEDQIRAIGI